jgi:hypothetical protein
MLAQRRRLRSANRAQEVVLACAIFDKHGKVMVTPEGILPNEKVTTTYVERVSILACNISNHSLIIETVHRWYIWDFACSLSVDL